MKGYSVYLRSFLGILKMVEDQLLVYGDFVKERTASATSGRRSAAPVSLSAMVYILTGVH